MEKKWPRFLPLAAQADVSIDTPDFHHCDYDHDCQDYCPFRILQLSWKKLLRVTDILFCKQEVDKKRR